MIAHLLTAIHAQPLFYHLEQFAGLSQVYLKLEGLNIAGSIKLKTARWMIQQLEEKQTLVPNYSTVICSSSGNLGIALSIVCKEKGYPFICVSDKNILSASARYIQLLGGKLILVEKSDENGGYLGSRLDLIEKLLKENETYVFVDQYSDIDNAFAHYHTTAKEIHDEFKDLNYLFIGAGTTGTLMGCANYFKQHSPNTKIIAIDAVGSVTFDKPNKKRYIPGLGTSRKPSILNRNDIDDVVFVEETETIAMCRYVLDKYGLILGGSSGTVLQGMNQYTTHVHKDDTMVAISPDFGERYLTTIYDDVWIKQLAG